MVCRKLRGLSNTFLRAPNWLEPWQIWRMDMRERIKAIIEADASLSVRSVSLAAGLSDSMLQKFLRGGTDSMTIKTAEKLAKALAVDPQWLIFGEGSSDEASEIVLAAREVPEDQVPQAVRILRTFARTGTDG